MYVWVPQKAMGKILAMPRCLQDLREKCSSHLIARDAGVGRDKISGPKSSSQGSWHWKSRFFSIQNKMKLFIRVVRITTFAELLIVFNLVGGLRE